MQSEFSAEKGKYKSEFEIWNGSYENIYPKRDLNLDFFILHSYFSLILVVINKKNGGIDFFICMIFFLICLIWGHLRFDTPQRAETEETDENTQHIIKINVICSFKVYSQFFLKILFSI